MPLQAELRPLPCTGGKFDLVKIPYITLIDTMDTLVVPLQTSLNSLMMLLHIFIYQVQ